MSKPADKKGAAAAADEEDNGGEDDDNDNNNKELNVDEYKYAEDDMTSGKPGYRESSVMVLPRHLQQLVQFAQRDEWDRVATAGAGPINNPLRVFRAPHPRHGELVLYMGAAYNSVQRVATAEGDEVQELCIDSSGSSENVDSNNSDNNGATARLRLYEIQTRKPNYATWFIDNDVENESPLYVVSPIHSGFIALRVLVSDALTTGMNREAFIEAVAQTPETGDADAVDSKFKFRSREDWMHIAAQIMFMSDSNSKKSGGGEQDQQQQQQTQQQHPFPDLWTNYLQDAFDLLCEKKAAAQEAIAGGGAECFYRLSLARVRDWLKGRFERVARSAAFDRLVFGSSKQQQQQQQQPASANGNDADGSAAAVADKSSDAREQERRAIAERAFGLVAEYVPTAIQHGDLRRWLLGAENAKYVAPRPPAMTPDFHHNSGAAQLLEGGAAGADALKRQKVEAPQSASAKRLAKAGAPKGTPSVASFFVKKK